MAELVQEENHSGFTYILNGVDVGLHHDLMTRS